ncbi:MAG: hypothetical protein HFI29_02375 [Lachnospiraceae bacterium]|jgi:hypothetical protein|nr:hypothetical protein [Lachnospiraceae bacterium]
MKLENENLHKDGFTTLKKWMENRNAGKTFVEYFHEYGYKTIGIYDAGDLGRMLYEEVKDSDITVKFFVDRNAEGIGSIDGIPVIFFSQISEVEEADVLLVSPIVNYEAVNRILSEKGVTLRTMSFKDAVFEF